MSPTATQGRHSALAMPAAPPRANPTAARPTRVAATWPRRRWVRPAAPPKPRLRPRAKWRKPEALRSLPPKARQAKAEPALKPSQQQLEELKMSGRSPPPENNRATPGPQATLGMHGTPVVPGPPPSGRRREAMARRAPRTARPCAAAAADTGSLEVGAALEAAAVVDAAGASTTVRKTALLGSGFYAGGVSA